MPALLRELGHYQIHESATRSTKARSKHFNTLTSFIEPVDATASQKDVGQATAGDIHVLHTGPTEGHAAEGSQDGP